MSHKSRPVSRHSQPGTQARGNPPVVSPLPLGAILPQQQGTRAPQPVNYYRGSSSRSPPGTATEDQPWGGTLQPTSRDYKKANEDGAHSSGAVSFSPSPHPASVVRHYPYTSPQEVFLERMERLKPKTPSGMATPIPSTPLPTRTSTNSSLQSQRPPAPPPPLPAKVVAQPTKKRPAKTKLQVEKVDRATSTQPSVALTPPKSLQSTPISATKEPRPPTVKPQERAPAPQSSPHPQERPPAPKPSSRPQERVAALAPKPPPTLQNNWLDAEANSSAATSILLDQLHSPQLRSNAFDGEGNGQSVSRQVMLAPKLQLHLNRHARGVPVIEPKQAPTATGGHPHSEDGRGPSSSYAAVRTPAKQLVPLPADDSYYDGDHEDSIVTTSPSGVLVGPSRASSRAPPAAPAYPGIFINVYDSGLVQRAPSTVRALPPPPVVAKPQPSAPAGEVPVHDSATKQSPPPAAKALPPRPVATKPPPPPREVPVAVAAPIPPRSPVSSVCSTPSAAHSAARRHLSWYRLTPYFPGLVDGHKSDEQIVRELEERLRGQQKEAPAPLPPLLTEESRVKDDAPSVLSSYRPSEHGERSLALKEEDSRAEDEAPCVVSPCPGSKSQLNCERSQPLMQEDSRTNDAPSILSSYRPSEQDERSQLLEEDARVTEEAPCILSSSRAAEQSERSVPLQVDVPVDDAPSVLASGRSSNFRDDRPLPLRQEESRVTIVTPSSGRASGYFVRPVPLKSEDSRVMETFPSFTSFQPSGNYARSIPLRPDDSRGKMLTPSAMSSARLSEQFVRPHPLQAEDCRVSHEEAAVPQLQASEYFERPLPLRQDESRVTIITPSSGRVSDRRERPLPLRSEDGRMETFPSFTSLQASEHQAAFETEDSAAPVRVVRRDEVSLCSSFADARDRHASLHEDEQLTDEERPPPPRAVTTAPKESEPERVVEEPRQVAAPVAVQDGYPINLQDDLQDDFDPVPISLHEPPPMEEALQADPWSCVAPVRSAASDAHEQLAALDDGRWFLEASGSTGRSIASTSSQGTCGSTARLRQTVRVGILADGRTSGVPLSSEMSAGPSTPKEVLWSTAALERFCAGVWLSRLAAVAPALSDLFPPTAAEEGGVGSSDHSCEYVAAESEELLRSPTYEALPRKFQGLMAAMVRQSIDVAISAKDASCDPFVLRPIDDDAMRTLRRVALDGPSGPEESEESDAFVRHCGGLNDIGNLNCIPTTVWQSSCAEPAYQLSFPQHVLHCLCTIQRAIQKKRQVMPDPSTPSEVEEHGCQVVGTAPTAEEIKQRQSWSLFMGAPRWRLEAGTMSTTSSSSFRGATGMSLMIDPAVMSDVKPMTTVATDSAWMHNVPSSTICDNSVLDRNIPTECYASMGFHSILAQQLPEVATYDRCAMLEKLKLALRWGSTAATMGESVGHPSHESRAMEWPSSSLASWMEVDVQPSTSPSQTTLWAVCRQLRRFFPSKDLSRLEHVVSALVVDLVEAGVVRCKSANGTSSEAAALQQAILVKEATEILMRALTPDNMKVSAPEQVRFAVVEGQNASYGYDGAALALHRTVVPIARLLVEERLQRLLVVVSLQHTAEMVERSVARQSIVVEERGKQKNGSSASGDGPLDGDRTTLVPSARWSGPMGSSVTVGSVFHAMLEACVGTPFVTIGDRQRRVLVATYLRHVMLLYLQFGPNANPTSSKSRRLLEAQPEEWFPCVDAPSGTATYLGDEVNVVVKELASFCPLVASALPCV